MITVEFGKIFLHITADLAREIATISLLYWAGCHASLMV